MPARSDKPLDSPASLLAIGAFLVLVSTILTIVVRERPVVSAESADQSGGEPLVRVLAEPPLPAPLGTVLIDAIPWGRVSRIERPSGEGYHLPGDPETPVLLELPAGDWIVALSSPSLKEEGLCELTVTSGLDKRVECLVEFDKLSVDQYFEAAGWWR